MSSALTASTALSATANTTADMADLYAIQQQREAKAGMLGVGSKPVVALRFDDYHDSMRTVMNPLLTARGLPAGHASISRLWTQSWAQGTKPSDVLNWNKNGIEVWSHGVDHLDPSPKGDYGLIDQIVNSKAEIEAWGVKVQGWMQPGATALGTAQPYGTDFTTPASMNTKAGRLIRKTYPLSEAYASGAYRRLGNQAFHGVSHVTASDGKTAGTLTGFIDNLIAAGAGSGCEFLCHAGNLDQATYTTLAAFTTFLDYIVTKRDAGLIEVLTPSGLMFATTDTARLDLVRGGNFEGGETDWNGTANGATYGTTSPHGGTQYLSIPNTSAVLVPNRWRYDQMVQRRLDGETFLFEGWARSNGVSTTTSRVVIQSYPTSTLLSLSLTKSGITTSWTKVSIPFSVPPTVDQITWSLGRTAGDGIDWDDVSIKKV